MCTTVQRHSFRLAALAHSKFISDLQSIMIYTLKTHVKTLVWMIVAKFVTPPICHVGCHTTMLCVACSRAVSHGPGAAALRAKVYHSGSR